MLKHREIWLPDGETHLTGMIDQGPVVDGKGTYQYKKLQMVLAHTPERNNAIDVGAHVGLWAAHLAKLFKHVHCFEPIEAHRECFVLNMEGRPNHTLYPVACGDHEGLVDMRINPHSSGDTWVDPKDGTMGHQEGGIQLVTIDRYGFEDVSLIKLDCEGYELFALKGAEHTIKRWKPTIIVEQKPGRAEKYGLPRTEAVTYLKGLGMKLAAETSGDYILTW